MERGSLPGKYGLDGRSRKVWGIMAVNDTREEIAWLNIQDYGKQCREKASASIV